MKRYIKYLLIVFSVFILCGCVKEYKEKDIANYVHDNIGLTDFKVLSKPVEVIDIDGWTDKIWSVYDNKESIQFHVIDDHYYGMESASNSLKDDYIDNIILKYYKQIKDVDKVVVSNNLDTGINIVELYCNYKNKNELKNCYDSLVRFYKYFTNKEFKLDVRFTLKYDYNFIKGENVSTALKGDYVENISKIESIKYDDILYNYYSFGLGYRIDNIINEMSAEDIKNVMNNEETVLIYKIDDSGNRILYDNMIALKYAYGISYQTLYYIFEKEGFTLEGNKDHYKVSDVYGNVYEFFQDFYEVEQGYYYLKNGEKTSTYSKSYNFLTLNEIKELFNLSIDTEKNSKNN